MTIQSATAAQTVLPAADLPAIVLPAIVLIVGADRFRVMERYRALRSEFVEQVDSTFGVDDFEGVDTGVVDAIAAARTTAMFGGRRLVVLRDGLDEETIPALLLYAETANEETTLLVVDVRSGRRSKAFAALVKTIDDVGRVVDVEALPSRPRDLADYVSKCAISAGVDLARGTAAHVATQLGRDSGAISALIDQLAVAAFDHPVTSGDIEQFVKGPGTAMTWDLTDAIDKGNRAEAVRKLRALSSEMHALQIQSVLTKHVRKLLVASDAEPRTARDVELAIDAKGFGAKKVFEKIRSVDRAAIERAHHQVATADIDLRGGSGLPDDVILDVLVVRLARTLGGVRR